MEVRISKKTLIVIFEAMPENTPFEDCLPEFVTVEAEPVEGEKPQGIPICGISLPNNRMCGNDKPCKLHPKECRCGAQGHDVPCVAHTPKSECRCPGLCPLHFKSVTPKTGDCCDGCWIYNDAYGPKLGYCSKSVCPCHTKREECCELCILPRMSKPMCGNRQCECHETVDHLNKGI